MSKKAGRPSQLERCAYHEAGHAAASFQLGRRVVKVTIEPDAEGEALGLCVNSPLPKWCTPYQDEVPIADSLRKRAVVEQEILIQFAGHVAEARRAGRNNFRGAAADYRGAFDLASLVTSGQEETDKYLDWLAVRSKNLFRLPWEWAAVEAVARGLLEKRILSGREAKGLFLAGRQAPLQQRLDAMK
jgi:hypothetical protein